MLANDTQRPGLRIIGLCAFLPAFDPDFCHVNAITASDLKLTHFKVSALHYKCEVLRHAQPNAGQACLALQQVHDAACLHGVGISMPRIFDAMPVLSVAAIIDALGLI